MFVKNFIKIGFAGFARYKKKKNRYQIIFIIVVGIRINKEDKDNLQ